MWGVDVDGVVGLLVYVDECVCFGVVVVYDVWF